MKRNLFLPALFICLSLIAPVHLRAENALVAGVKIITTKAGVPYKVVLPSLLQPMVANAITKGAQATVPAIVPGTQNIEQLIAAHVENAAMLASAGPIELNLTQGLRNGTPTYTVTHDELSRYLNTTLPNAPVTKVHQQLLHLQTKVDNTENFFLPLVKSFYFHNFAMGTPHTRALFERVAAQKNPEFEQRFLERLALLAYVKDQVATAFSKKLDSTQIRIRYIHDLDFLTAENFHPEDLLISVEQKMSPALKRNLFSHLTGETKIKINRQPYRIYNFKGPLSQIEELYKFLVLGNSRSQQMYLTIDHPRRALFLYNADKSVWLRVTPHEFSSIKKLHLHVHRALPFTIKINDLFVKDRVLLNLSIPVASPKELPEGPRDEVLYNLFVGDPVEKLRKLPGITVLEKF